MSKRTKIPPHSTWAIATDSLLKPSDFPVGSPQSRAAARAIVEVYIADERWAEEAEFSNLTELQAAMSVGCSGIKKRVAIKLAAAIELRARIFNMTLPQAEEIGHALAVVREIDRMTNGRSFNLRDSDPVEWNRLKAIAEENLKFAGDW